MGDVGSAKAAPMDGSRDLRTDAGTVDARQTEVAGRILVTTLTDARTVAPLDLDALYRQRWQVEVDCVQSRLSWAWTSCGRSRRP